MPTPVAPLVPGWSPATELATAFVSFQGASRQEDAMHETVWTGGGMTVVGDKDIVLSYVEIKPTWTTNNFYRMQLLQTGPGAWNLFSRWGRVGEVGEWKMDGPWHSLNLAERALDQSFKAKTKTTWADRHEFKAGAYGLVELDDDGGASPAGSVTGQPFRVIFDVETYLTSPVRVSLDPKHMPLGTLSDQQIQKGMAVLESLGGCLDGQNGSESRVRSLSAKFYQLIPHANRLTMLNTPHKLNEKCKLLTRLLGIVTGMNVEKAIRAHHILDSTGLSTQCDLNVVAATDPMHPVLVKYMANGDGAACGWKWKVQNIWATRRHSEDVSFSAFATTPNHQLLWHGTGVDVLASILKSGLRNFGRGMYLATMLEKAKCHVRVTTALGRTVGCVFLVEAALGNVHHVLHPHGFYQHNLPRGFDSVLARGKRFPDPSQDQVVELDGVNVRVGVGSPATVASYPIPHDEYVVFEERQVRLRYVITLEMDYNT